MIIVDKQEINKIAELIKEAVKSLEILEGSSSLTVGLTDSYYYLKGVAGKDELINREHKIYNSKYKCYGVIGEITDFNNYHVGDMVEFVSPMGYKKTSLIVKNGGCYSVFGWGKVDLETLRNIHGMRLLKKYDEYNKKELSELSHFLLIK